jgi:hypothetical protein
MRDHLWVGGGRWEVSKKEGAFEQKEGGLERRRRGLLNRRREV